MVPSAGWAVRRAREDVRLEPLLREPRRSSRADPGRARSARRPSPAENPPRGTGIGELREGDVREALPAIPGERPGERHLLLVDLRLEARGEGVQRVPISSIRIRREPPSGVPSPASAASPSWVLRSRALPASNSSFIVTTGSPTGPPPPAPVQRRRPPLQRPRRRGRRARGPSRRPPGGGPSRASSGRAARP